MGLPVISGANPAKIHQFYELLLFNVQVLETLGKLKEVNGYVRMSINILSGIRGNLVRTDENWQEWDFTKFVYALQEWTERNPVTIRSSDKPWRDSNAFNTQLGDALPRGGVYCDSTDHKPNECTEVSNTSERRKIFLRKRLHFNCTRDHRRATECKSRKTCLFCKRRHDTSICDRGNVDISMTATQMCDGPVVYPVVVVEVAGIKCRAPLDSGAGSSYASVALVLLERIGAKPHHSGLRKIEMMLGASSRVMEIYRIKLNSVKENFLMEVEVTKVEKPHLITVDNPRYKKLVEKHPLLKGVTMVDNDERPRLPVHIILGNKEFPRISTTEPQRVGRE